jgi:hypothetical protein
MEGPVHLGPQLPTVVNVYQDEYDIYIGRPQRRLKLAGSKWANPFLVPKWVTKEYEDKVLAAFEIYLAIRLWNPNLPVASIVQKVAAGYGVKHPTGDLRYLNGTLDLKELLGKRLGCFCAPSQCHGDILLKAIKNM